MGDEHASSIFKEIEEMQEAIDAFTTLSGAMQGLRTSLINCRCVLMSLPELECRRIVAEELPSNELEQSASELRISVAVGGRYRRCLSR